MNRGIRAVRRKPIGKPGPKKRRCEGLLSKGTKGNDQGKGRFRGGQILPPRKYERINQKLGKGGTNSKKKTSTPK